jgi:3'-5' exoribonuclease 1
MKKFMVIDFEATCFEGKDLPENWFQEIIEIGLTIVDPEKLQLVADFQAFVRPVLFPKLSDFCKNLTSITQDNVDKGISFSKALLEMENIYRSWDRPIFTSFGKYDYNQLYKECKRFNEFFPFDEGIHCNIKQEFCKFYKKEFFRGVPFKYALKHVGLEFEGIHHRGIDDAKMISKILIEMLKAGYKFNVKN